MLSMIVNPIYRFSIEWETDILETIAEGFTMSN